MRILLVEDEEDVRNLLVTCLQRWGHEVVATQAVSEAWDKIQSGSTDLIISDWHLPSMAGTELVKKIRHDERYKQLPILMISGQADRSDIAEAIHAGITGFLHKPFAPIQLQEKLEVISCKKDPKQDAIGILKRMATHIYERYLSFDPTASTPLVVFGVPTNTVAGLSRLDRKDLVLYLYQVTAAIARANAQHPMLKAGYLLAPSTHEIMVRLRNNHVLKRITLMLVSQGCEGDIFRMVRLLRAGRGKTLPIVLVCDSMYDFPMKQRSNFAQLQVGVIERRQLEDVDYINTLIKENVVEPTLGDRSTSQALPQRSSPPVES